MRTIRHTLLLSILRLQSSILLLLTRPRISRELRQQQGPSAGPRSIILFSFALEDDFVNPAPDVDAARSNSEVGGG